MNRSRRELQAGWPTLSALLALVLSACPSPAPDIRPTVGPDRWSAVCPEALELMNRQRHDEAVDLLRTRSAEDPRLAADPLTDICLGRALIGQGSHREALQLLMPLATDSRFDPAVQATACLYGAWATAGTGDLDGAAASLDACDLGGSLDPLPVLLPADEVPAAMLLFDSRSRGGFSLAALSMAGWLLESLGSVYPSSTAWVLDRVFAMARTATADELDLLSDRPEPLLQTAALFGRIASLPSDQRSDALQAQGPLLIERLNALGAPGLLNEVEQWLEGTDQVRPALFGAILSLTGPGRRASRAALAGLLLAQMAFDASEAPRSRLLILDSGSTDGSARNALAALDDLDALATVVHVDPELADSVAAEAQARGLPCLIVSDAHDLAGHYPFVFQFSPDPSAEARVLVDFAVHQGLGHIALVIGLPASDTFDRLVRSFSEQARMAGLTVDEALSYSVDDLQREAQTLSSILASRPFDALLVADTPDHALTLAAYLGVEDIWARQPDQPADRDRRQVVFLGNSSWHDPDLISWGPDYLAGAVLPTWIPLEQGTVSAVRFTQEFGRVFGRRATALDAFAHDALFVLRTLAVESGLRTRGSIRDALERLEEIDGATGEIRFGPDPAAGRQPDLLRITRQGFEPL